MAGIRVLPSLCFLTLSSAFRPTTCLSATQGRGRHWGQSRARLQGPLLGGQKIFSFFHRKSSVPIRRLPAEDLEYPGYTQPHGQVPRSEWVAMVVVPPVGEQGEWASQDPGRGQACPDLGLTRSLGVSLPPGCAINATRLPSEKRVCPGLGLASLTNTTSRDPSAASPSFTHTAITLLSLPTPCLHLFILDIDHHSRPC